MKRERTQFVCQECGYSSAKWLGKCPSCGSWNSFVEESEHVLIKSYRERPSVRPICEWEHEGLKRKSVGFENFDRAIGGGIVPGQVMLLAGEPGIGKSTLLLQVSDMYAQNYGSVLYVSGEESGSQIAVRGRRTGIKSKDVLVLPETRLEVVLDVAQELNPQLLVVDSIQTLYTESLSSSPGSVSQVRECAFRITEFCKSRDIPVFLVGQITKEGNIAGPKVLEHLVDTVLYFEGERFNFYRIVKVVKNRFGSSGEVAVFRMLDRGLEEVPEPSAFFLQERTQSCGSVVFPYTEGSKPVLVEVQALTIQALYTTPQRRAQGYDVNRLSIILAVLEKECKIFTRDRDVFVNVVGGMQIREPAADLAVALAIISSIKNKPIPDMVAFGEIGLSGELRAVHFADVRLKEAVRFGFSRAILPKSISIPVEGMEVVGIAHLRDVLEIL
ncbi:MAG: DNA repair protein RadA [Hydrogenobacter thermophilus]|uniref:DNA repair protein RadA n=1 Tax=Hydrogenobacter thermophilus TaxID=940 RepID=UPI001C786946|nr:DNA repair protein RadA [Hydrogenobacter thermophilus]QWK20260.1 MAG: DNA repair protein RadA [Hydrogenobacter thermophilus]